MHLCVLFDVLLPIDPPNDPLHSMLSRSESNTSDIEWWFLICTTESRTSRFVVQIQKACSLARPLAKRFAASVEFNSFWNHRIEPVLCVLYSPSWCNSHLLALLLSHLDIGLWSHTALKLPLTQCRIRLSKFGVVLSDTRSQVRCK